MDGVSALNTHRTIGLNRTTLVVIEEDSDIISLSREVVLFHFGFLRFPLLSEKKQPPWPADPRLCSGLWVRFTSE